MGWFDYFLLGFIAGCIGTNTLYLMDNIKKRK